VGWSVLAGIAVARYPGPNALDRWAFDSLAPSLHSTVLTRITELGSLPAVAVGSVGAALVVVGRDRWRAAVCLVGPLAATAAVEWVAKPVVGRHFEGVLTFPSGTVTAVASLAVAWALALPGRYRWIAVVLGTVVVVATSVAVVGLRWHYASDALGGAAFGVGSMLAVDGLLHRLPVR
jgi:membrane-associated phospholipid phosphatase